MSWDFRSYLLLISLTNGPMFPLMSFWPLLSCIIMHGWHVTPSQLHESIWKAPIIFSIEYQTILLPRAAMDRVRYSLVSLCAFIYLTNSSIKCPFFLLFPFYKRSLAIFSMEFIEIHMKWYFILISEVEIRWIFLKEKTLVWSKN
jgi:hypothetical protein